MRSSYRPDLWDREHEDMTLYCPVLDVILIRYIILLSELLDLDVTHYVIASLCSYFAIVLLSCFLFFVFL